MQPASIGKSFDQSRHILNTIFLRFQYIMNSLFQRSKSSSMDERKALEILDVKLGVYQRLKKEKKMEELLELLSNAMMEQSKQWMDGERIRNEIEDVTVFNNAYHFIVQNCLDENK